MRLGNRYDRAHARHRGRPRPRVESATSSREGGSSGWSRAPARSHASTGSRLAMTSIAATGLAVAAAIAISSGASAADPLKVQVGAGAGQISANAYLPGKVTVEAGSSVTFSVASDEPHSVTFGTGPDGPAARPVAGDRLVRPGCAAGHAHRPGRRQLRRQRLRQHRASSGTGSTATVTFPTVGSYIFACEIHPGMSGEIDVVAAGAGGATTQADADAAGKASADSLLSQVGGRPGRPARGRDQHQERRRHHDLEHLRRREHRRGGPARWWHRLPGAVRDAAARPRDRCR